MALPIFRHPLCFGGEGVVLHNAKAFLWWKMPIVSRTKKWYNESEAHEFSLTRKDYVMKRMKWITLAVGAVALAVCLLALAACGGDQPSDTESTGTGERGTAADTSVDPTDTHATETAADTDAETNADTAADTAAETEGPTPGGVVMADIYPTPMEITYNAYGYVIRDTVKLDEKAARYAEGLAELGISVAEDGLPITVTLRDLTADFAYGAEEAYILRITEEGISMEAQTDRGVHYAFMTLFQLIKDSGPFPLVTVKDAPRNRQRGVIEGFYGTAWTHEYRKELFAFMGQNKMNAYIYAPKDDPKHRAQWRSLYTGAELERMTDLIDTAKENYVKFIYAISPGGDINLGSGYEADFQKLMAKCEQIYELGCRDFAIFLDDIPTLDARGHGKLLTDFQTRFVETHEGVSNLIAITTEYGDPFLTDYTNQIAPLIHKDIELMWTGPGVIPESITNDSLRHILRTYGRNVLIWWNYPVNDTLANHLFMGPCVNLEKDLYKSITGLTANPMNQGYASLVPLFTTGDYLWNPEAYDAETSLAAACRELMPDAHEALLHFISMTCASGINKNTDSVELQALLTAFKKDNTPETRGALKAYFDDMVKNADAILTAENGKMVNEIRQWVEKYRVYGEMGLLYADMEEAFAAGKEQTDILKLLGEYKTLERSIRNNPRLVSASVLTPYFSTLNTRFSILLGEVEGITFTPATPYTNCNHYQDYIPDYLTDGDDSTYLWTHGDLNTAAGNKVGYFGVDLGEVVEVHNVYIATGVGGSDVLKKGVVEYSADGKTWVELHNGTCGEELFLQGLAVQARYVRIKAGDSSDGTWVKARAFEVNTTRTVVSDAPAGVLTWSTSLPVYQTYGVDFMKDSDPTTYFWSSRGGQKGDYFEIDLGAVVAVSRITFKTGVPAHAADCVQSGELCYSADGQSWTRLGALNGRDTVVDVDIRARYVRVNITADQTNWITVSEFTAVSEDNVSPLLQLDSDFVPRTDLLALTDGHYVTYFAPECNQPDGHFLNVTFTESGRLTLIILKYPDTGMKITVRDASGERLYEVSVENVMHLQAPAGSTATIYLGDGLMLSEIEW